MSVTPRALVPSLPRFSSVAPVVPGAPRQLWAPTRVVQPWMHMPTTWRTSQLEWVVFWYLTRRRAMRLNRDFFYQMAVNAPGLFVSRLFTRSDFVIPTRGRNASARRGIILDPVTPFTHPRGWFDARRRSILALFGWRLVFLEGSHLNRDPRWVIELALRGVDVSSKGGNLR